jgi:hypothetical protein
MVMTTNQSSCSRILFLIADKCRPTSELWHTILLRNHSRLLDTVYCGGWEVGRIYQTRGGPESLRWFWSMTVNGAMTRSDRVPTLEEAKEQFQKSWDAWKAWAKLEEVSETKTVILLSLTSSSGSSSPCQLSFQSQSLRVFSSFIAATSHLGQPPRLSRWRMWRMAGWRMMRHRTRSSDSM